jgi:hypothetical protein
VDGQDGHSSIELKAGRVGAVSFCAYADGEVLADSAGTPYRLTMKHLPTVAPYGLVGQGRADGLVYGQRVRYGPVWPINAGPIQAPPSEMRATLTVAGLCAVAGSVAFDYVGGCGKAAKYRELGQGAVQHY